MPHLIATTWNRWLIVGVLSALVGGILPWAFSRTRAPGPPMQLRDVSVAWEDERHEAIIVDVGTRHYFTTCPSVLISRWIVTATGQIYQPAIALDGPLAALGPMSPRRVISIEPGSDQGSTLRLAIPDWAMADPQETILGVRSQGSVPDDKPCANGYVGRFEIYEALLPTVRPQLPAPS